MRRLILFFSSYIPLYILLIIKNILERCTIRGKIIIPNAKLKEIHLFDEVNDYAIVILALLSIGSLIYLITLKSKKEDTHYYEVVKLEDQTGNIYFNYISLYLLSCLGLTLNRIVDVFVLCFLMLLIGYIYVSNHMTYMNPMLQILGYKIYEGELLSKSTNKKFHSIIIARKKTQILQGNTYKACGKEDFVVVNNNDNTDLTL